MKDLFGFIKWLFTDMDKAQLYLYTLTAISWSWLVLPDVYFFYIAVFVGINLIGIFLYMLLISPLIHSYRMYKQTTQKTDQTSSTHRE